MLNIFDDLNQIIIDSDKAIYNEIKNTILSKGVILLLNIENIYDMFSKDVFYDRNQ